MSSSVRPEWVGIGLLTRAQARRDGRFGAFNVKRRLATVNIKLLTVGDLDSKIGFMNSSKQIRHMQIFNR